MTTIILPPLPRMTHYGGQATVLTADQLRARDLKVARLVLEAAAKMYENEAWRLKTIAVHTQSAATNTKAIAVSDCADMIRALEVKHHDPEIQRNN